MIVDSQVHIWADSTPERPWPARHEPHRPVPITAESLLADMAEAGVDRAVLVPPSFEGDRNDVCLAAAQKYPERFAVMGRLDPEAPESRGLVAGWRRTPGMLGMRFTFHRPSLQPLLTEGRVDWLWPEAEKAGVPVMMSAPHAIAHLVAPITQRHPGLKLVIDHMGLHRGVDDEAFRDFDRLFPLAALPNVAVKVSCLPLYTADPWPHRRLHPHLKRVYDAFGPRRMFWGSDLSRLKTPYRDCVTMFTEGMPWLTKEDLDLIMGRALVEWIGWGA